MGGLVLALLFLVLVLICMVLGLFKRLQNKQWIIDELSTFRGVMIGSVSERDKSYQIKLPPGRWTVTVHSGCIDPSSTTQNYLVEGGVDADHDWESALSYPAGKIRINRAPSKFDPTRLFVKRG